MKKLLYLVRHATAEEGGNTPMFRDFDRILTSHGIIEAARMGKHLAENNIKIELLISSEADRCKSTAKIFAEQLHVDADEIKLDEAIYGGGARAYLAAVNNLDEKVKSVAIFGHNPDITFFAEYLTRADIGGSMEKASVVAIEFEDVNWNEISNKSGRFLFYWSPGTIAKA
ncbi:histidine phosphatase family protein [Emticicia sp. TH156]|uniref:SixA phosphatase family protein n=1 Tax=Emticicia sp. TH156 TaxID=2067454 RepID=UPI00156D6FE6|nr:histidine phosphatase family protein [Emticicia sp. TH156]